MLNVQARIDESADEKEALRSKTRTRSLANGIERYKIDAGVFENVSRVERFSHHRRERESNKKHERGKRRASVHRPTGEQHAEHIETASSSSSSQKVRENLFAFSMIRVCGTLIFEGKFLERSLS